ncbi:Uncharacterised protein [Staphylococcus aureus]|nr:Uncharacterised protein [Staphylococcus aureus]
MAFATFKSYGVVTLMLYSSPRTNLTGCPDSTMILHASDKISFCALLKAR